MAHAEHLATAVCSDRPFEETVDARERDPAELTLERGRETGHRLTIEWRDEDE